MAAGLSNVRLSNLTDAQKRQLPPLPPDVAQQFQGALKHVTDRKVRGEISDSEAQAHLVKLHEGAMKCVHGQGMVIT